MKYVWFVFSGLIFISIATSRAESSGSITAQVVDPVGNPVAGATVWFLSIGEKSHSRPIPDCTTDEEGRCSRTGLSFGRYRVTAMKESDGYPNTALNLFGHDKQPVIAEISSDAPGKTVRVTLGPKAGAISVQVTDSVTGKPINNPTIKLYPAEKPSAYLTVGLHTNHQILIPINEDIVVEATADGYKPWRVGTQAGAAHPNSIRLHLGEVRELSIGLRPQ